jgi:hypothetical protein
VRSSTDVQRHGTVFMIWLPATAPRASTPAAELHGLCSKNLSSGALANRLGHKAGRTAGAAFQKEMDLEQ